MPSVKVCLWNIQNYGWGKSNWKWGADSDLRNWFITDFLRDQDIDVLLMMEMTPTGESSLHDLTRTLFTGNTAFRDWVTCYCGAAITRRSPNPPTNKDDLLFKTDARYEGYAVAWRTGQTDRFSVLPGLHPIAAKGVTYHNTKTQPASPLNLTTVGRPAGNVKYRVAQSNNRFTTRESWEALGGYITSQTFPYDADGVPMDHWPPLEFSATGKGRMPLMWANVRHPAYIVLKLNVNSADERQQLCPVAVYHAPSKSTRADLGALQAGLSRELYVTNGLTANTPDPKKYVNPLRTVFGGDFNYSVNTAAWPNYYQYFPAKYSKASDGGAECQEVPVHTGTDEQRRTTVRLVEGKRHNIVITGPTISAYLAHKIDLVFFRGQGVTAQRINIPQLLLDRPDPYKKTLQKFHTHLENLVRGLAPPNQRLNASNHGPEQYKKAKKKWKWVPMLSAGWSSTFEDWDSFMEQLKAGKLTEARQAAEFYSIFVSDHLPLVVTIDL